MSKSNSCRLGVESLEGRWTPAVDVWVDQGVLYAQGDKGNNAVGVRVFADTITVLDGKSVLGTRPVAGISRVVLGGGFGGNDTFLVQGDDTLGKLSEVSLLGDKGDDRFLIDTRANKQPVFRVAGRAGFDRLGLTEVAPRSLKVEGLEDILFGRLAAAQTELRDLKKHPEMANLFKMLQIPPGSNVITSDPGRRGLNLTKDVIYQFDVEYTARYRKGTNGNNDTRCNVFVGDVLMAMRAPLPTKAQFTAGGDKNMWVGAADAHKWLTGTKGTGTWKVSGAGAGWVKVDPRTQAGLNTLLAHVAAGKPAVASTKDHIAFVRPNQPGGLTPATLGNLWTAQAGSKNFTAGTLSQGWPASRLKEIVFFVHE